MAADGSGPKLSSATVPAGPHANGVSHSGGGGNGGGNSPFHVKAVELPEELSTPAHVEVAAGDGGAAGVSTPSSTATAPPPCPPRAVLRFGLATLQGPRGHMEDRAQASELLSCPQLPSTTDRAGFFAVYDGHSGAEVSEYLAAHLLPAIVADPSFAQRPLAALERAVLRCEEDILHRFQECTRTPGSTALASLVIDDQLFLANVGDSRAVLCRSAAALQLTVDHKPCNPAERDRILQAGGEISGDGYLFGELAVARALGNRDFKVRPEYQGALICQPELAQVQLTKDDDFIVIATDGLWEVLSNVEVVRSVRWHMAREEGAQFCARGLVERAATMGLQDNVSVIVVLLNDTPAPMARSHSQLFKSATAYADSPR